MNCFKPLASIALSAPWRSPTVRSHRRRRRRRPVPRHVLCVHAENDLIKTTTTPTGALHVHQDDDLRRRERSPGLDRHGEVCEPMTVYYTQDGDAASLEGRDPAVRDDGCHGTKVEEKKTTVTTP